MYIPIYFNGAVISQLPVNADLSLDQELMGRSLIAGTIDLPGVMALPIGAYISVNGHVYTINTLPGVTKSGTRKYQYTFSFESEIYRLYDKKLRHLNRKTFQYYGNLTNYAQLIVDNINEIDSGWTVGNCDVVAEKTIDFDGATCADSLSTIAEAFSVEWQVIGKSISFVKQVGYTTAHVFKYGQGKGLYTLGYKFQDDKNIVTRAYGYGSTRNLPQGYRDGANQLLFPELYLQKNTELYRVKEGDYVNEDIYPKVDGLVTAAGAYNPTAETFTIADTSLTFNLNDYFSSETPKVSFLSGELQGQEFEILSFDNASKIIKLKVFIDGNNNRLPNATFQAAAGNKYTLFDMFLPAERVAAAEAELKAKTQEWLDENSVPRVLYSLELDPLYARDNNIRLNPGDKVTVVDDDLGINAQIRVVKTSYPLNFPAVITPDTKISVEIANFIPYTKQERIIADTIDNQKEIKVVDRINAERARRGALNLKTLQGRIFNPDGSLFEGPESIIAGMAAFGYDSQNFNLNDVTIAPNAGADANSFLISAGQLIHHMYKVEGLGYIWNISNGQWSGLNPTKFYYVYAKCNKSALTGTWEISESPVTFNAIPGYYAFNLGILYEVNADGYRDFEFTKGMTYIVGDQITTGRIKSLDGTTYFDLNAGEIGGRIKFSNGSSGYDNLTDKPDLSIYSSTDYVNAIKDSLQNQIDGQITSWFYDYEPTLSNQPASDWITDNVRDTHLGDLFYWTSKGYAYRYAKDTTTGAYIWLSISDTDIVLALQKASIAQDTADGKRRVFITTPVTPYDIGDLWAAGSAGDLKRCIVSRATGTYNAADWDKATKYTDDSTADAALANAANAQSTADRAAEVTDGLVTIIDGNLVATGTLLVGDATHVNGGITGATDQGNGSVRFWAGVPYANRYNAPFRVTEDGQVFATTGMIGNFTIDGTGLKNTQNIDAYIDQTRTYPSGKKRRAAIGTSIDNISILNYVGMFENTEALSGTPNGGLYVSVKGGSRGPLQAAFSGNTAAFLEGDIVVREGNVVVEETTGNYQKGATQEFLYTANGRNYYAKFVKGIFIGVRPE